MTKKHLVVIHGRATKPRKEEKQRLVMKALQGGLERVDATAADLLADPNKVQVEFAYYGHITNRECLKANPHKKTGMVQDGENWYEPDGSYDKHLELLMNRPTEDHTAKHYEQLLATVPDQRYYDDAARVLSPLASLGGLSNHILIKLLPDLGAYVTSRLVASQIRETIQEPLQRAMRKGEDVAIISHSMGCMVTYDVLWKFSRMSEYRELHKKRVSLWITLGSPLGEPGIQKALYDSNEPEDGRYPCNIDHWVNIAAHDDFVAHDGDIADDFNKMRKQGHARTIEDLPRIHNFWTGTEGSNPHKLYGYLNHPTVANKIAEWIRGA